MVGKNKYGFYSILDKPSIEELEKYYKDKYYQNAAGGYEKEYSAEEVKYINNKINEKYFFIENHRVGTSNAPSLLDIGCGEGWVLKYFKERGWEVTGLDYSDFACQKFNPDCLENLKSGDIYTRLHEIIKDGQRFDVVWLDNVLEHVLDPEGLVHEIKKITKDNGVLTIEVPNDFSKLQEYLLNYQFINREFWVVVPDHISYFNKDGLENLMSANGWQTLAIIGDYPIDWNLLNPETNYIMDRSKGKACHLERVVFENFIHEQPLEKVVAFYKAMAELGLGRQIVGFFSVT